MFQHPALEFFSQVDMDATDALEIPSLVDSVDFGYDQELYTGMIFENKKTMYSGVKLYHVKNHHIFIVVKSNKICIDLRCPKYNKSL